MIWSQLQILWKICLFLLFKVVQDIDGHGRLMDPPARNSMWRLGFPNPVNYNDNELFCGGWAVHWEKNKGKCGICGDAFNLSPPRPHEAGGLYAKGVIGRHYTAGQEIDVEIDLTANHMGYFELLICPNNDVTQPVTQECFDRHPLYIAGTKEYHFKIDPDSKKKEIFRYKVQLPPHLTCTQCVIQWNYYAGNQWGLCPDGTEDVGCGRAELFRNCADVSIVSSTGAIPPLFIEEQYPFVLYYKIFESSALYSLAPYVIREQVCLPTPLFRIIPGMEQWCQTNCLNFPPNCPPSICYCPQTCDAIGEIAGKEGADEYCLDKCLTYPQNNCPKHRCDCY